RHVARLIHPDQCTDDETRRLADLQMKRLNGMLAVLADGTQRAKYDASIAVPTLSHPRSRAPWPDLRGFLLSRPGQQALAGMVVVLLAVTLAMWPRPHATPKPIMPPPQQARAVRPPKEQPPQQQVRP